MENLEELVEQKRTSGKRTRPRYRSGKNLEKADRRNKRCGRGKREQNNEEKKKKFEKAEKSLANGQRRRRREKGENWKS